MAKKVTKKTEKKSKRKVVRKNKTKRRRNKNSHKKTIFKTFLFLGVIFAIYLLYCFYTMPDINKAISKTRQPTTTITADNGNEIQTFGNVYQKIIMAENLKPFVIDAVISTEDRRFYSHFGFDFVAFTRAMFRNIVARKYAQGGSTITQQVAKNLFLTPNKNIKRKVQELMLAFWLEHKFSKEQIMTLYLNRVYFGSGTYGIQAASQKYFQKPASDLNMKEAAIIAGILKAPSRLNPIANPKLADERAVVVLENMLKNNTITKSELEKAKKLTIGSSQKSKVQGGKHFADWLYLETNSTLGEREDDIIVYSTLDQKLQETLEIILEESIKKNKDKNVSQGAIVVMENTGAIRAMVGGIEYDKSQFNRATQAIRHAGSTFKTFVYLTALENGYTPKDKINDSPITINGWSPKNINGYNHGKVDLDLAFSKSLNLATVNLAEKISYNDIIKTAKKLGILSNIQKNPSIALGAVEVKLLEMITAYATIANGGYRVYPYGINEIYTKDGHQLYFKEETTLKPVVDKKANKYMISMLENVVKNGTGKKAQIDGMFIAGKTGTSNEFRDAWFIGFTKTHVIGVWVGNDDNSPMNYISGGNLPAEIFQKAVLSLNIK